MPDILKQIDKNKNFEISGQEISDFLDGKDKSFLPNETNLKEVAKTIDDNLSGRKHENYIDMQSFMKVYSTITEKIQQNKDLLPGDIKILKLYMYLQEGQKNINFAHDNDITKNTDIMVKIHTINKYYKSDFNYSKMKNKDAVSIVSLDHPVNKEKTFEKLTLQEKTQQLQTIVTVAEVYGQYLQQKKVGQPKYE